MERGRSLFFFKVKGKISKSLDLYKKIPALGSVRAGCTKKYAVSMLKLSMETSYEGGRSQLVFKVKVTGSLLRILALWSLSV